MIRVTKLLMFAAIALLPVPECREARVLIATQYRRKSGNMSFNFVLIFIFFELRAKPRRTEAPAGAPFRSEPDSQDRVQGHWWFKNLKGGDYDPPPLSRLSTVERTMDSVGPVLFIWRKSSKATSAYVNRVIPRSCRIEVAYLMARSISFKLLALTQVITFPS